MPFTSNDYPILVIIGPSGAGKSTVLHKLVDEGLVAVTPSWTTRLPRPGEIDEGIEHRFVKEAEFKKREKEGYFLETVQMFGLPFYYGLPSVQPSRSDCVSAVMLRATLMPLFNKHYPNNIVYQISDDISRIKQRLEERQTKGEPLGSRLSDYEKEVTLGEQYAKRMFVNDGDIKSLAEQLKEAIRKDFQ